MNLNKEQGPRRLSWINCLVRVLSLPRAVCLYLRLGRRSPASILWLESSQGKPWRAVWDICAARLLRRLQVATDWAVTPVIDWPVGIPRRCVIAFFHSNWDAIIAREFAKHSFCLVRTNDRWASRFLGGQHIGWQNPSGLLRLIRSVVAGARSAVAMDDFINDPAIAFAGTQKGLSAAPLRIAALTRAPLVPVWPVYERGTLRFIIGPCIDVPRNPAGADEALRLVGHFFEDAVHRHPASWQRILKFLDIV